MRLSAEAGAGMVAGVTTKRRVDDINKARS